SGGGLSMSVMSSTVEAIGVRFWHQYARRLTACWRPRPACFACFPSSSPGGTGPVPNSPAGSASACGPCAATSTGCATSATPSTRHPAWRAVTGSAPAPPCPRCCWATRGRGGGRSARTRPPPAAGPRRRGPRSRGRPRPQQMLPSRLRRTVTALHATAVPLAGSSRETVDADVLTAVAAACRDQRRLRFGYPSGDRVTSRHVEPHRLVHTTRRWYLVA